jgi:hypothetical protein
VTDVREKAGEVLAWLTTVRGELEANGPVLGGRDNSVLALRGAISEFDKQLAYFRGIVDKVMADHGLSGSLGLELSDQYDQFWRQLAEDRYGRWGVRWRRLTGRLPADYRPR